MSPPWEFARDPLEALGEGDSGPFEELVRRHVPTLLEFYRRQGVPVDEAEDLVQDVMLKLYRAAPRYRPEERLPAYVFRVATHALVDRRRRHGARGAREAKPGEAPVDELPAGSGPGGGRGGDPGERLEREDDLRSLRRAVAELPRSHRLVVELGAVEGLSYAEVGRILDVPVGTVKSRMFNALKKLRRLLGADDEGVA